MFPFMYNYRQDKNSKTHLKPFHDTIVYISIPFIYFSHMKTTNLQQQTLKAWLNYNCTQGNNWIVKYQFDAIVSHAGRQMIELGSEGKDLLTSQDLSHIYLTYMTQNRLITLIETYQGQLYLIDNQLNLEPEADPVVSSLDVDSTSAMKSVNDVVPLPNLTQVTSKIYHLRDLKQIRQCLSSKEMKLLGVRYGDWLNLDLKKVQKDELSHTNFLDFIHLHEPTAYVSLLNQFFEEAQEAVSLQHNYSVTPALLDQMTDHLGLKQITIYQNFQIDDFTWLRHLPNLRVINLFYNHQMEQRHFEQIVQVVPGLVVFNVHCCTRINLRVLIPIFKLRNLEILWIDDEQFWCQKSVYEVFISSQEWKSLEAPSLRQLIINSTNLTLDVIDYLMTACENLQQMSVDESILKDIASNINSGFDKTHPLIFNSCQNPNKGFKIYQKVSFNHLFKDTYNEDGNLFSESMLKKIAERRALTGEKEQTPIVGTAPHP